MTGTTHRPPKVLWTLVDHQFFQLTWLVAPLGEVSTAYSPVDGVESSISALLAPAWCTGVEDLMLDASSRAHTATLLSFQHFAQCAIDLGGLLLVLGHWCKVSSTYLCFAFNGKLGVPIFLDATSAYLLSLRRPMTCCPELPLR